MGGATRPSEADVMSKLKDDGDFDNLRLAIIRKVKENEELRNSIIEEVKQSLILNSEGVEDLKPRQLSDGIYQEVGSKIMGKISDEVWKLIRSDDTQNQIQDAVRAVHDRLTYPKADTDKKKPVNGTPSDIKNEIISSPVNPQVHEEKRPDNAEEAPPRFSSSESQHNIKQEETEDVVPPNAHALGIDDLPPGFAPPHGEDLDVPPGFG